jgi:hypothetical protein
VDDSFNKMRLTPEFCTVIRQIMAEDQIIDFQTLQYFIAMNVNTTEEKLPMWVFKRMEKMWKQESGKYFDFWYGHVTIGKIKQD